ncbi:MAG: cobalt ECF transporter T component CbiQ [Chloroflexota bacterium]|nr:MAG: cobalt ECF transporter T component CbiQ [Chloroflexota bacterium]
MRIASRYQAHDSVLHRFDPRLKVVVAVLLIVGVVMTPDRAWVAFLLIWLMEIGLCRLGRVAWWRVGRMAGIALPFTLAAVTLLFSTPGPTLIHIGGVEISENGLIRFGAIVARSWLAVQFALLLSMTTRFDQLLWALHWWRLPPPLVSIIGLMVRYLYTLADEAERLLQARAARSGALDGRRSGGSVLWRAKTAGGMVGNLFLRSYERGERVYMAMVARGYTGQMLLLDAPPLTRRAVLLGCVPLVVMVGIQIGARVW